MKKKILITRATDGIGLATAKLLSSQGHHLLIHGRSSEKINKAVKVILEVSPNTRIDKYFADLSLISNTTRSYALANPVYFPL